MPKQSITQLLSASKDQISYNDLLIGTAPEDFNYNLNTESLVGYLKNYSNSIFPVPLNNTYINFNNTNSSVSLSKKIKSEIESVTFDNYGNVISIASKTRVESVVDMFQGTIALSIGPNNAGNLGLGYFYNNNPLASNSENVITNKVVRRSSNNSNIESGTWSLLFDRSYNYSKSIITYYHGRLDKSESKEQITNFKFIINWDGENKTKIMGTGTIGTNPSNSESGSYIWKRQSVKDNTLIHPMPAFFGRSGSGLEYQNRFNKNMAIEVDGKNKLIKKLPVTAYVPNSNRVTHTVSVTIESFA